MNDILLVDDDACTLRMLSACIDGLGDVRIARNGQDAERLVQARRPDLLVLDLHLEDTDGLSLLRELHSQTPPLAQTPVLFLSSDASVAPRAQQAGLPVFDCLVKPVDEARLRQRVHDALQATAGPGTAPQPPVLQDGLRGARVLVVDDDSLIRDAVASALAPSGLEVVCASGAAEALARAAEQPPEVVLLDVCMPEMDGHQLAQRLMAMPGLAGCPILFLTQNGDLASEVRALQAGAFDFVTKPFVPAVLLARLGNALRLRRRSLRELEQAHTEWRRVSASQVSAIVANGHDPVIVLDAEGRIALVNEAAGLLASDDGAPRVGAPLPDWLRQALPEPWRQGRETVLRAVRIVRPHSGAVSVFDVAVQPSGSGPARLVTLTFHDQTLRLQAELQAREQLRLESETRVRRLMMSYLMHEIGNPLQGVIGLTQLLLAPGADPLSEGQRRKLGMVAESAEVLRRLMADALDLAQHETGQFSVRLQAVPLRPLLNSVLSSLQPAAERGAVRLIEGFGPPEPVVTADPVRLRQCLDNLIGNACKYGVRGGYVRVDLNEEDGRTAIHVSDNGPGLTAEQIERLFKPYERLGQQGSVTRGHGLGLAVTRMLAGAMGGQLEVSSTEGYGSLFTLVLPSVVAPADPLQPECGAAGPEDPDD